MQYLFLINKINMLDILQRTIVNNTDKM